MTPEEVREALPKLADTDEELARMFGVTARTIRRWKKHGATGAVPMSIATGIRCRKFGVPFGYHSDPMTVAIPHDYRLPPETAR